MLNKRHDKKTVNIFFTVKPKILWFSGSEYSYSEILTNTLYYVHDNSEDIEDTFTLRISDSLQSVDVEIPITIQYSDTSAPTLSSDASMKLRVNEG